VNQFTSQIGGLQFELAMALGGSLDLQAMLNSVLNILLRRLDGRVAAVYGLSDRSELELVLGLPRSAKVPPTMTAEGAGPGGDVRPLYRPSQAAAGIERYVFSLPGFGVLILERRPPDLEPPVLSALEPLMQRLGRACRACVDHARLRSSEARFADLVGTVPEVIFEAQIGPDSRLVFDFISPRAHEVIGVDAQTLSSNPAALVDRLHPDEQQSFVEVLGAARRRHEAFEHIVRLNHIGDGERWLLIAGNPREQAVGLRWSGLIQDVTARQRLVASEREIQRLQMSALLGAVGDALVGADASGRITHWNRGAERLLGYPASAVLGQSLTMIMTERMRHAHERGMARHIATAEARLLRRPVEFPALHADGHEVEVELVLDSVEDKGELFFVGSFRDLTDRRRAEREHARVVEEERRFAAALVQLSRSSLDGLALFERHSTEIVAQTMGVAKVGLWAMNGDSLSCNDLFETGSASHSSGLLLEETQHENYFRALRGQASIVASDAVNDPATSCLPQSHSGQNGVVSRIDLSMSTLDGTRWVLSVESTAHRDWRPSEVRFCTEVAGIVTQSLERLARVRLQARHDVILSAIGDAVVACDVHQRITVFNPVAESLTGWSVAEAVGQPIGSVVRLLSRGGLAPIEYSIGEDLTHRPVRAVLSPRVGQQRPVEYRIASLIERSETIGSVLTFRDVSEEETANRVLEQQNQRFRSLSEAIPDTLLSLSKGGRLQYEQRSTNTVGEEEPRDVNSFFPPDVASRMLGAVEKATGTGEVQAVEYSLTLPDGLQWFEARLAPMSEDEATVIVRDVTDERTREAALREQRERLEAVLSTTSAIIYVARLPDYSIEYVSDSVSTVLGFGLVQFSEPGFWSKSLHPDDRVRVVSGLSRLLELGRHLHEYRHRHADGSYRWLRDEVRLVYDDDGRPLRAVGASFDITERKVGEQRLSTLLAVQEIVSRLSASFLRAHEQSTDDIIASALADIGKHIRCDRVYIFKSDGLFMINIHEWCREGVTSQIDALQKVEVTDFRFLLDPIRQGNPLYVPSVAEMPSVASVEREHLERQGIKSLLAVPMAHDGEVGAFLGIDNPELEPLHHTEYAALLQLLSDAIAAGLQRSRDELALRQFNETLAEKTEKQRSLLELSLDLARATSREDLSTVLNGRLRVLFNADRVSQVEEDGQGQYRARLLDINPSISANAQFVNPDAVEMSMTIDGPNRGAIQTVMKYGVPLTTRERQITDFPEWQALHETEGYNHFVIVPLFGINGAFGTLNVGFLRTEPPSQEDIEFISQFGSTLAANLATLQARRSLERLNQELESRIDIRTRELRESEQRFEQLFAYAPQAMLMVDASGRVVQSNHNAQRLFGIDRHAFIGAPVSRLLPPTTQDHHERLMDGFVAQAAGRPMNNGRIVEAIRDDGTKFSAEIGLVPVDLNGTPHVLAGLSDVTARLEAEAAGARSLHEKETLLKEIHHRVKNNLQIISSLLMLQREQMPSDRARSLLEESVFRVRSMAFIHQQLYGVESLARIDFGQYAKTLSESLRAALAPQARLKVDAALIEVNVEMAVPLGLILNELVTNAFKYGLRQGGADAKDPVGRTGEFDVIVEVGVGEGRIRVAVSDSGPGMPDGLDVNRSTTLGLQLVRTLNRQLRGRINYAFDHGSRFEVTCAQVAE
jgi:PAS domain S-box-containing protein